ncbi:MAG: glycosyltransferase family 39 protein [Chloroflexi bacterium]|nr:glycosyltransferase family 39 protein [Chloroflexota bacterium]
MDILSPADDRRERLIRLLLFAILVVGTALRVVHFGSRLFHVDEALFASYGLLIASGKDLLLQTEPVDKPPLFFYVLGLCFRLFGRAETVAALPSLAASVAGIYLVYRFCRDHFGPAEGLVAAALLAASPFDVSYSYTAFIDPTMVGCVLLALLLAGRGHFLAAGVCAGLLPALKAQGILFWPVLALAGVLFLARSRARPSGRLLAVLLALVGTALPLLALAQWSAARPQQPPFLDLATAHNPLVPALAATYTARLAEWWQSSLQFFTASAPLNVLLLAGLPLLLLWDLGVLLRGGHDRLAAAADWGLAAFGLLFVGWHVYYQLPAWDRYMVGLGPFALILLARILTLPWHALTSLAPRPAGAPATAYTLAGALVLGLGLLLTQPVQAGLQSAYSLGWSGSGGPTTYQGLPAVIGYLKAYAPPGAKIYDYKSLSWHYKYYLFDQPLQIVWFDDTYIGSFQQNVAADRGRDNKFLVLPAWEDDATVRRQLEGDAVLLTPLYRTYRDDGTISFTIYKVEARG